jgi:hypothetical protein
VRLARDGAHAQELRLVQRGDVLHVAEHATGERHDLAALARDPQTANPALEHHDADLGI